MKSKSYQKNNWKQKYPYKRKRKSIFKNRFFWLSILIFVFFIGIFYFLVFSPVFQIRKINIQGTILINASEAQAIVDQTAERKILFLPTRSIIVFKKGETKHLILEKFLPVEDVIFEKSLPNRLVVKIIERKTEAILCPFTNASSTQNQFIHENCFLVDKQGLAFYKANRELMVAQKTFIFSGIGQTELGKEVIEKEVLQFIISADYKLEGTARMKVSEFIVYADKVEARTEKGMAIYFDSQKDINQQIEDLVLVMENEISPTQEKGISEKDIEYIDLRFDKVFYKHR